MAFGVFLRKEIKKEIAMASQPRGGDEFVVDSLVGRVVKLRSGGPDVTVASVDENGGDWEADVFFWCDHHADFLQATLPVVVLTIVKEK